MIQYAGGNVVTIGNQSVVSLERPVDTHTHARMHAHTDTHTHAGQMERKLSVCRESLC